MLESHMKIFNKTCLLPDREEPRAWLNHLRYLYIRFVIVYTFYYAFIGAPAYAFYLDKDDQQILFECFFFSFNEIMLLTKVINFVYRSDQLYELVNTLDNIYGYVQPFDPYVERILSWTKKICHFLTETGPRAVLSLTFLGAAGEGIRSLVIRDLQHRTRCWFSFDVQVPVVYEIYVLVFSIYFVLNLINALFIDTLIVCMLLHMLAQSKIVNHKLKNIREVAMARVLPNVGQTLLERPQEVEEAARRASGYPRGFAKSGGFVVVGRELKGGERLSADSLVSLKEFDEEDELESLTKELKSEDEERIQTEMYSLLQEAIVHQSEIFVFLSKFEEFFSPIFLVILLGNLTTSVVILAWAATTTSSSTGIMILVMGAPFMYLCELVLYCFLVDMVTEESAAAKESVYSCDWLGSTTRFKRSMCIVMTMSNQPKGVSVAGFVPLTLVTVHSVLSTAYSYYMVLLKFG